MKKSIEFEIIPVPADGDCFYHAFIKSLNMDTTPRHLRKLVAMEISKNEDLYDDLLREWVDFGVIKSTSSVNKSTVLKTIKYSNEWATSTVIHILATLFNVKIIVFQRIQNQFFSEEFPSVWKVEGNATRQTESHKKNIVYILRTGQHFEMLLPKYRKCHKKNYALRNKHNKQEGGTVVTDVKGGDGSISTWFYIGSIGLTIFYLIS